MNLSSVGFFKREVNFELCFEAREDAGRAVTYLVHPNAKQLRIEVWLPDFNKDKAVPEGMILTTFSLEKKMVRLAVRIEQMIELCKKRGYITLFPDEIKMVCEKNAFADFVSGIVATFPWRKVINRYFCTIGKPKTDTKIVDYLYDEVPKWKEACQGLQRIFIPGTKEIPYSFEYRRSGDILMYFSNVVDGKQKNLAMNLKTGELSEWEEFKKEEGERIYKFKCLKEKNVGLIHFRDLYILDTKEGVPHPVGKTPFNIRFPLFIGHHTFYDSNVLSVRTDQAMKMAHQLVRGLITLESEEIVHCGICPSTIYFLNEEFNGISAALTGFQYAFKVKQLPKDLRLSAWERTIVHLSDMKSYKWEQYIPEEARGLLSEVADPFAIPVYQLGVYFREKLFNRPEKSAVADLLIEVMTEPNPKLRWKLPKILCAIEKELEL